jgi:hypothetical protein
VYVEFTLSHGVHSGTAEGGRAWSIHEEITGWRMEFRDPGDRKPTNAGLFRTPKDAMTEAQR